MVKWDPTMIFSLVLTKRAVAVIALRQGGIPVPQNPVAGYNTLRVYHDPVFLVSTPRHSLPLRI